MNLLLHICCGPCAIFPVRSLQRKGFEVQGFFYNPNIHPFKEFQRRLDTLKSYAESISLQTHIDGRYLLEEFLAEAMRPGQVRCESCYLLRLRETAKEAVRRGFSCFSTTLLVSPYQNHEMIRAVGERVAAETGIGFYYEDFRTGWPEAVQESRSRDMYRQPYCGCIFSEKERYYKGDKGKERSACSEKL